MEEKIYFLRGSSYELCGFIYNGEVIIEGVTCPANVDSLAINVSYTLSSRERSGFEDNEQPLKIKILSSSYKESDKINITITTVSGKKLAATVNGLLARPQGEGIVLVRIDTTIRTKIQSK